MHLETCCPDFVLVEKRSAVSNLLEYHPTSKLAAASRLYGEIGMDTWKKRMLNSHFCMQACRKQHNVWCAEEMAAKEQCYATSGALKMDEDKLAEL